MGRKSKHARRSAAAGARPQSQAGSLGSAAAGLSPRWLGGRGLIVVAIVAALLGFVGMQWLAPEASGKAGMSKPIIGDGKRGPIGMAWVPGGEFLMGSDSKLAQPNEKPAHKVRVKGFWMDQHHVTNAQFRAFVEATKYVTTAERKPDWDTIKPQLPPDTPRPPDAAMVPGALVFVGTPMVVDYRDASRWWRYVPGANWRQPLGPGSSIAGKDEHPVVQVELRRRTGLRQVGRQAPAHRGRVGVRRARRAAASHLRMGRRVRAGRPADGQRLAGPAEAALPRGEREGRRRGRHESGRQLSGQRLWPERHDRQCLAMGGRLVSRRPVRARGTRRQAARQPRRPVGELGSERARRARKRPQARDTRRLLPLQ